MTTANDSRVLLARRYAALAPRERVMVAAMGSVLALLIVWTVAVRPAWRTLSQAPALRAQADLNLLQMQATINEAKQLRALPPISQAQAEQALKAATDQLNGKGKLTLQTDHATLSVTGATGEDLRQWLQQARSGARARPTEATLTRVGEGYNGTLAVAIGSPQ